jgi:hypothetical protein
MSGGLQTLAALAINGSYAQMVKFVNRSTAGSTFLHFRVDQQAQELECWCKFIPKMKNQSHP